MWLAEKIRPDDIDKIICAEFPDKETDLALYEIVCKNMVHGPCGRLKPSSPCMVKYPPVIHLAVHLENGQRIYFTEKNFAERMQNPTDTTLTGFFSLCQRDDFAKTLFYHEVPAYYIWTNKTWQRRKRGQGVPEYPGVRKEFILGRIYTIHPNFAECFYLRLLLHHIKGPTSFLNMKTINEIIYPTYRATCEALGLLESDLHWKNTISEAVTVNSAPKLRELFVVMLIFCHLANPLQLWNEFKRDLCEDIIYRHRCQLQSQSELDFEKIFNEGLLLIDNGVYLLGEKRVSDFGLPTPIAVDTGNTEDLIYIRETSYEENDLSAYINENKPKLIADQRNVYEEILNSVTNNENKVFFWTLQVALAKRSW